MLIELALLVTATAQQATPAPSQPSAARTQTATPYGSLWVDWKESTRAAASAEAASSPSAPRRSTEQAASLGERVGEMVATGNCRGGEQLALDAGDLALARAVRDYCNAPAGR